MRAALARIERDDRHLEVWLHLTESVSERTFGDWAVLHDPAASWIWSQDAVANGAVEQARPVEIRAFFMELRDLHGTDAL